MSKNNVEYSVTRDLTVDVLLFMSNVSTCIHMLFLLCENNVLAFLFHVEFSVARDMTVDFCCICPNFSTYIYMLFLLCGNNVQACVFHVECNAT